MPQTVAARLQSTGARVFPARKDGRPIYRVAIGPFQQVEMPTPRSRGSGAWP
jgi:hypothetical protein